MQIFSVLTCLILTVSGSVPVLEASEFPQNGFDRFFPDPFVYKFQKNLGASKVHGRFLIDSDENHDLALLHECADLNYSAKKKTGKFVKKLKETFSKKGADKKKLEATLGHFHCVHAISS